MHNIFSRFLKVLPGPSKEIGPSLFEGIKYLCSGFEKPASSHLHQLTVFLIETPVINVMYIQETGEPVLPEKRVLSLELKEILSQHPVPQVIEPPLSGPGLFLNITVFKPLADAPPGIQVKVESCIPVVSECQEQGLTVEKTLVASEPRLRHEESGLSFSINRCPQKRTVQDRKTFYPEEHIFCLQPVTNPDIGLFGAETPRRQRRIARCKCGLSYHVVLLIKTLDLFSPDMIIVLLEKQACIVDNALLRLQVHLESLCLYNDPPVLIPHIPCGPGLSGLLPVVCFFSLKKGIQPPYPHIPPQVIDLLSCVVCQEFRLNGSFHFFSTAKGREEEEAKHQQYNY